MVQRISRFCSWISSCSKNFQTDLTLNLHMYSRGRTSARMRTQSPSGGSGPGGAGTSTASPPPTCSSWRWLEAGGRQRLRRSSEICGGQKILSVSNLVTCGAHSSMTWVPLLLPLPGFPWYLKWAAFTQHCVVVNIPIIAIAFGAALGKMFALSMSVVKWPCQMQNHQSVR